MNSAKRIDTVIGDIASAKPPKKSAVNTKWRITAVISISRHVPVAGLKRAMGIGNRRNCIDSHSA
jgi:hypothetical protein